MLTSWVIKEMMDKKQHAGPVPPRNMTVNYSQYNPLNILHKSGIFTTAKHLYQQFKRSIQSYKKLIQCFIFFFCHLSCRLSTSYEINADTRQFLFVRCFQFRDNSGNSTAVWIERLLKPRKISPLPYRVFIPGKVTLNNGLNLMLFP